MGSGSWSARDWDTYSTTVAGKATSTIYAKTTADREPAKELQLHGIKLRESRDSVDNPRSTPVIVAIDETGSMGELAGILARDGLGTLAKEILARKPITDPHMLFMAIGDAACDQWPIQATQFEADNRIVDQLNGFYLEGNGGGNGGESYLIAWYFAAFKTEADSMQKRNKRGYLFTVGDELCHGVLTKEQIKRHIGDDVEADFSAKDLVEIAGRSWNIFHLMVECGGGYNDHTRAGWKDLLGEHALPLADYTQMSEVIVSTMQVIEGVDKDVVVGSWNGSTAITVKKAIDALTTDVKGSVRRFK